MGWYNNSWLYRQKITVDHTKVGADLTNYPIYVNLANLSSGFFAHANSGGGDIRVTTSDGTTECAREVVFCTNGSSVGELHFKAPSLSSSVDTDFYIYYGNSGASDYATNATFGAQNVWDSNYILVIHGGDGTTLNVNDSTSNANNGTNHSTTAASGQIGGGIHMVGGSSQYIATGTTNFPTGDHAFTYQCWHKNTASATSQQVFLFYGANALHQSAYLDIGEAATDKYTFGNWASTLVDSANTYTAGTYRFVYGTYDGAGNARLQIDGDVNTATGKVMAFTNSYNNIGRYSGGAYDSGDVDEIRYSNIARATTWMSTDRNNQSSPSTFYTVSAEQVNTPPVPSWTSGSIGQPFIGNDIQVV